MYHPALQHTLSAEDGIQLFLNTPLSLRMCRSSHYSNANPRGRRVRTSSKHTPSKIGSLIIRQFQLGLPFDKIFSKGLGDFFVLLLEGGD